MLEVALGRFLGMVARRIIPLVGWQAYRVESYPNCARARPRR